MKHSTDLPPLVVNGAEPSVDKKIPYHRPSISFKEIETVEKVLASGQIAGPGIYCEKVERQLQDSWEVPRVLTTTSCTHALEIALLAMELQPSSEVIVPAFTYVSTALAVVMAGGRPVFADIDPDSLTITAETVDRLVTDRTEGIIMVHYGGFPGPAAELAEYARQQELFFIEDAAQVFGSYRDSRPAGTFGRFGVFSFHGTKSLTCGEGGMLLINSPEDVRPAELLRDKGTDRTVSRCGDNDRYTWRSRGSSYVLSDILGAILWEQLQRWPQLMGRRIKLQQELINRLSELDKAGLFNFIQPPETARTNGHITAFLLKEPAQRDWLLETLQQEGIEVREHYHPLHLSPYAQQHLSPQDCLPVSEKVAASLLRIPCYPKLTSEDIDSIVTVFQRVYPHLRARIS